MNITSLPFREGLGLGRMLILCLSLATIGVNEAWGEYKEHTDVSLTNQSIEASQSYTYKVLVSITGYRFGSNTYDIASIPNANGISRISFGYKFSGKNGVKFRVEYSDDGGVNYHDTGWGELSDNDSRDGNTFSKDFASTGALLFNSGKTIKLRIYITDGGPNTDPRYSKGKKLNFSNFKVYYSQFALSYDGNGGSSPSGKNVIYGSTYGDLATSSRTGYTFDGWFTAASGGTQVTSTTKVSTASDHTLCAHWTANTYQVSFDAGANSTANPESKQVTFDGTYGNLATTTRAGLEGWYTDKTGGSKVETTTTVTITNSHTLYARYNYYAKATSLAVSNVDGDAGGGTYISINGGTPTSNSNYIATEDKSTKTIVSYNENPTTASYFAAQAKTGFKFIGWYSDKEHTQLVSSDAVYQPTITVTSNNSSSPTTLSLYAYFEVQWPTYYGKAYSYSVESQTGYTWISMRGTVFNGNFTSDVSDNSHQEGKYAEAPTFPCVFYAGPKDGYAFAGWYDNAACTGTPLSTSTANWCNYNENLLATSTEENNPTTIHRYAKFAPVTVSAATAQTVNFTAQTQTLTTTLTFAVTNADAKADFNEPAVTSGDAGWTIKEWNYANNAVTVTLSFTATENTTTKGDHTAIVTLTAKSGKSATGQVTAHVAMTPTLTDNVPASKLVDDAAIDLNTLWTSTSNGTKTYTIKTWTPDGGAHNGGAVTPSITGSTLSLGDAGTLVLQLSQAAGTSSESKTAEHTLTINRRDNHISINGSKDSYATSIYMDGYAQISSLTATNTDYIGSPFSNVQTSGNDIATFYQNDMVIYSTYNLGPATWTISQPENYKYKAANATLTVNVVQQAEATDCYVLENNTTTLEAKLGGTTDELSWSDQHVAKTLYFSAQRQSGSVGDAIQTQQKVNGSWSNVGSEITNQGTNPTPEVVNLSQDATAIRFKIAGSYKNFITNVRVTRKTYLNADNVEIKKTKSNNPIYVGASGENVGVGTLTINHSLANGGDLKVKWDNAKFTIDGSTSAQGINLGDKGCSTGISSLPITYSSMVARKDTANVVIYNNVYRTTATIIGTTVKRDQEIQWNTDVMIVGQTEAAAARTTAKIINPIITYTSDSSEIIRVNNDANGLPTILEAVHPGTVKITAFSKGNGEYNDASDTKEITVTDKDIQFIVWNQSLMGLKMGDSNVLLNASASEPDSLECQYPGQRPITYQSMNESIVQIENGNQLKIVGVGVTSVIASQAGGTDQDGHDFIPITAEKKVVVRDPNAPCETYIYEQTSEVEFDLSWIATSHKTKTYEIDFNGQEPRTFNFDYKGKVHTVWPVDYYAGELIVEQYVNNQWVMVKNFGKPGTSDYTNTDDIALNRNATKMRVIANDGMGYMYFKDCRITLARYLEGSSLNTFETKVGSPVQQTLTVNYSNISGPLTFSLPENSKFSINKFSHEGECGGKGSTTIVVTYNPTEAATNDEVTLTLADGDRKTHITLKGKATVTPLHIEWDIPDNNACYTIDQVSLSAKAFTDLNEEVPNYVWFSVQPQSTTGTLTNGNILSFNKAGSVTIAANTQTGDAGFSQAPTVSKTWTVNLTPTQVTTKPTISAPIVSGTSLSDIVLEGGAAQNTVNNQAVEGTFAITAGDLVNVGEKTLTVTFTPDNTDMYEGCTTTITANVVQREATAEEIGTPSAAAITYGEAINTSSLSGNGTLAGTWSWTDEDANKVIPNAGTVDNLNVYFTPNDANVKKANGTVSLTVYRATPELTWTAEHATATVHEKKTFTASSTNTDNTATITYSIISGGDCASINATTGEVTMTKAGTITIKASQAETTNYNAVNIETTCTISVAPTTITTAPTTDNIVSGTSLNEVILTGGEAQNIINNQTVEGTFAVTAGNLVNVGEQTLTITFTPTEGNKYAGCTTTITATIVPRTPTNEEIGTPSATDIVYGNAVKSSALSRDGGTLAGTWSWSDTRKDDILNAGTYDDLQVHFVPEDKNYNEIDGTVSLTINKAAATLNWETAPTEANVQEHVTYTATSNHSESAITYAITEGNDCATIDANTGVLTIIKAGTITVQASQAATTNYEAAVLSQTTTLTGEFETVFIGNGDWNDLNNWTHGLPTSSNPDVVISGNMTIDESISVGSLTIEANGSVTIVVKGELTVNGESEEREAYGDLFVHNGGNVTIGSEANVKVHDFVIEASIGTQNGTSQSGQVDNGDKVIYTNGAYIDIHMDPKGSMDDTQWYGFTVPFQVNVQQGVYRKEGETFRKCTYGSDYMIAEYDMNQRLNTGNGWKYINSGELQPGHFYFFTVNGSYNTYRFKAAKNVITIENQTTLTTNGTGANANWNAVGNTTLTYATISGNDLPDYVQTYINGQSCYQVVYTQEAQFVVGCPFFFQAKENTTMVLNKPTTIADVHYAPRQTDRPICVRIAEDGKRFSDQMYITASEDAQGQYQMGRDLAKAGIGTKSAQLWINAYNQQLCVNDAPLVANQAFYDMSLFIPKAGNYEISLPTTPTNGTLYLTQDGYPIWNLNDAPFVLELGKGKISEYGLMFEATQAAAPTDVQTISGNDNAQKILKEQSIYIYKNGNIFNVTGQKVK